MTRMRKQRAWNQIGMKPKTMCLSPCWQEHEGKHGGCVNVIVADVWGERQR